jgi:hypothetical protein
MIEGDEVDCANNSRAGCRRPAAGIHGTQCLQRPQIARSETRQDLPHARPLGLALNLQGVHRVQDHNLSNLADSSTYGICCQGTQPPVIKEQIAL